MTYSKTRAYKKIKGLKKRIRIVQGGTSASKTVSVIIWLIALAQSDKSSTLTSIVSESFPHLRRGAMRDFLLIMKEHGYYKEALWDRTNNVYNFETGSQIEFFSVDQPEKVRGARRDRLFINEANNVPFSAFEELEVRTKEFVFLDYNPTNEFWVFTELLGKREDVEHLTLTYLDNEALSKEIKDSIETRKNRRGWWQVYGLGQLGEVEGKIYKDWIIIDEVPHEARLERYGLDFGYTNDPTAIVAIYYLNGGYIFDEIVYARGMGNKQIADTLLNLKRALIIADSAEPKSIDEIRSYGLNIIGVSKTRGESKSDTFKKWSIGVVQNQQNSVTKRSTNVIKEYRNYLWVVDKDGRVTNVPEHQFSHSMNAIEYPMTSLVSVLQRKEFIANMPRFYQDQQKAKLNPAR
ncbi:MAG: PBSX family phage terminase, large subunit [Parcubacteria group bacterium GW2011_GWF1_40_6]|nr:MAG: PBSX family phage terminase, large subunit [Parcubacteria group bacterium GW2011_GWF1_40_6]